MQSCLFFNTTFEESERARVFWVTVKRELCTRYGLHHALDTAEQADAYDLRAAVQMSSVFLRFTQVTVPIDRNPLLGASLSRLVFAAQRDTLRIVSLDCLSVSSLRCTV